MGEVKKITGVAEFVGRTADQTLDAARSCEFKNVVVVGETHEGEVIFCTNVPDHLMIIMMEKAKLNILLNDL